MADGVNTIANLLGKVDANGALLVALSGGAASATTMTVDTLKFNIANPDVVLVRDEADHLYQRRGFQPQRASWANNYVDATNFASFTVDWKTTTDVCRIGTRTGSAGGSAADLYLESQNSSAADAYTRLLLRSDSGPFVRLGRFNAAGSPLTAQLTQGDWIRLGEGTNNQTANQSTRVAILPTYNQASGTASNTDLLINRTQTAVGSGTQLLIDAQVGGTTQFNVLNTGQTIARGTVDAAAFTATPAGGNGSVAVRIGSSAVGHYIGTGVPTVSAAKGSIYVRTDATTTTTRLYINTDGGTTWTNFTSAA